MVGGKGKITSSRFKFSHYSENEKKEKEKEKKEKEKEKGKVQKKRRRGSRQNQFSGKCNTPFQYQNYLKVQRKVPHTGHSHSCARNRGNMKITRLA